MQQPSADGQVPVAPQSTEEEDIMFAKKPLQGWSCASCDKDIFNLQMRPGEFHPWSKLPYRDPSDRISRVGQGFSRMLMQSRTDLLSSSLKKNSSRPDHGSDEEGEFPRSARESTRKPVSASVTKRRTRLR